MTRRRKTGLGRMRALNIAQTTTRMHQGITGEGPFGPERWKIKADEGRIKWSYIWELIYPYIQIATNNPYLPVGAKPEAARMFMFRFPRALKACLLQLSRQVVVDVAARHGITLPVTVGPVAGPVG